MGKGAEAFASALFFIFSHMGIDIYTVWVYTYIRNKEDTNTTHQRGDRTMKYIVMDEHRDGTGDLFNTEHETLAEAVKAADRQWNQLTEQEQKERTVYVLESANPDEDAPDHLDGTPVWQDGKEA